MSWKIFIYFIFYVCDTKKMMSRPSVMLCKNVGHILVCRFDSFSNNKLILEFFTTIFFVLEVKRKWCGDMIGNKKSKTVPRSTFNMKLIENISSCSLNFFVWNVKWIEIIYLIFIFSCKGCNASALQIWMNKSSFDLKYFIE